MKPYYIYHAGIEGPYSGPEDGFFDTSEISWVKSLEDNWEKVLAELEVNSNINFSTAEVSEFQSEADSWQTIGFMFWSRMHKSKMKAFPETTALLNQVPNLLGASINRLKAGSEITLHKGETNSIYRCHLGLKVPGKLPEIGFQVNNEHKNWENGKLLAFCDAHQHRAWNNTKEDRYILLLDVLRPEYADQKYSICAHVLAINTLQLLAERFGMRFLYKIDKSILSLLVKLLLPFWYVFLPIHRWIGTTFK